MTTKLSCRPIPAIANALFLFCAFETIAGGATIHVPADHATIPAAINAANNGDTVLVAPGFYNLPITINGKSITIEGVEGASATTIWAGGAVASTVSILNAGANGTIIRGLTITGGKGTILNEFARAGGGIYISNASPTIDQCRIVSNIPQAPSTPGTTQGGGIYSTNSSFKMLDSEIADNTAPGQSPSGGGLYVSSGAPVIRGCLFLNNKAIGSPSGGQFGSASAGGANAGSATFIGCEFRNNSASGTQSASGGGASGGSLYVNCLFVGNTCSANHIMFDVSATGAGLSASSSTTLINCTILDNITNADIEGPGGVNAASGTVLRNCIVVGNQPTQVSNGPSVSYSCVEGGFVGDGNIDADPLFVDRAGGDFTLMPGSPAVDVAELAQLPGDANDLDGDGDTAELLPIDLDGNRRVVNGFVDMGAYEWQRTCIADISPSKPGVAGNDIVDVDDLLAVINAWGECDICVGDVDGDNDIDVDDLLAVINEWGSCK